MPLGADDHHHLPAPSRDGRNRMTVTAHAIVGGNERHDRARADACNGRPDALRHLDLAQIWRQRTAHTADDSAKIGAESAIAIDFG